MSRTTLKVPQFNTFCHGPCLMTNPSEFLTTLYQSLLGRPADDAGLAYWSEQLSSGAMSPVQVALAFSASPEAMQQVVPVAQLYLQVLGRAPDAEGLQYWVAQVRDGMSYRALVDNFQASAEFSAAFAPGTSVASFVTAAYQQVLGRAPDPQGLAHYVTQLESGVSRTEILAELSLSAEASARVAAAVQTVVVFIGVQGRPPSADELAAVLAQQQDGGSAWLEDAVAQWLSVTPTPEPEPEPGPGPQPEPLPASAVFTAPAQAAGGSSDASTAVALDADYMVVGDDEASILRVYHREGGAAVLEWDFGHLLTSDGELDLEASVLIGDVLYLLGSHGNKKDGDEADSREAIVAVRVSGTGSETQFQWLGQFNGLETALAEWDDANGHGLGSGALGLRAAAADGQVPEQVSGFSMEGMAVSPDGDSLWLGFRAPQHDPDSRDLALIVPLRNFVAVQDGTLVQPEFGDPIRLDLGGRGIRSIELAADGSGYLIVAGPSGSASAAMARDFRLFTWTGTADAAPVELDNDLDALLSLTGGSFETLVAPASILPGTRVQLLQDNGDTVWPGQTEVSKDLANDQQQFQGNWLELGQPFLDLSAPVLVQAVPAAGTQGAAVDGQIVLTFDERIERGSGILELQDDQGAVVASFEVANPDQVRIEGNQLTLQPPADLAFESTYHVVVPSGAVLDGAGNVFVGLTAASPLSFVTSAPPTPLAAGDIVFVAGNAEAPDAIAFVLLKSISGGTRIQLTDRNYSSATGFDGIDNEMAFVWTAGRDLPAGTVVTIQTDTQGSPIADVGTVVGAGGGIGKSETFYAMQGATIEGLTEGGAGLIRSPGTFLASLTLGGAAGDIPAALHDANAALAFVIDPANQTNARYVGSLDATDPAALAERIQDPANWEFNVTKAPGFPLVNGGFFAAPLLRGAEVAGDTLTLTWNQPLDSEALAEVTAFAVTVGERAVAVTELSLAGETLVLTLAEPVSGGAIVHVSYVDPSPADDGRALQSLTGVDVASFALRSIPNRSPDDQAPELVSWSLADSTQDVLHFAPLVLEFNEVVEKGAGDIVLTPEVGEAIRISVESAAVAIVGNVVTIDPEQVLAQGTAYQIAVEAGAFQDAANNPFAGLSAGPDTGFTTALAPTYSLLITEVNSNAKPADYFEVWNHGDSTIDLSGWRITDDGSQFSDAVTLPGTLQLAAGDVLVVLMDKDAAAIPAFRSAWQLPEDALVVALDGPGLGKGDAVLMFDTQGYLAAGFNFGLADVVASDGSTVASAGAIGDAKQHAGRAFGAREMDSVVWDGVSLEQPVYVGATADALGSVIQDGLDGAAGSPGFVPQLAQDLLFG